jgi:ATP-dependent protease HslVU (ClpYQ) peptidase subunit
MAGVLGVLYALEYLLAGSRQNFKAALDGLMAGFAGETGRPRKLMEDFEAPSARTRSNSIVGKA